MYSARSDADGARAVARRSIGLRGHRDQIFRAFPADHRRGDDRHRRRGDGRAAPISACGTSRMASITTCSISTTAQRVPLTRALAGRADSALRGRGAERSHRRAAPRIFADRSCEWAFPRTAPILAKLVSRWNEPGQGWADAALAAARDAHDAAACTHARRKRSSCRITVSARSRRFTRRSPIPTMRNGTRFSVDYEPGESTTAMFGGNSNWRGPVWMPINYLLIEALYEFEAFYGKDIVIELPTGSGHDSSLADVAAELSRRLTTLFLKDADGPPAGARRQRAAAGRSAFPRSACPSTNISTARPARGWAPRTRPAGRGSSRCCSSRARRRSKATRDINAPCSCAGRSAGLHAPRLLHLGSRLRGSTAPTRIASRPAAPDSPAASAASGASANPRASLRRSCRDSRAGSSRAPLRRRDRRAAGSPPR